MITPYGLGILAVLLVGAAAGGGLAWYALNRRDISGSQPFGAVMVANATLNVLTVGLLVSTGTLQYLLGVTFSLVAVVSSVLWFLFAVEYTGHDDYLTPGRTLGIAGIGVALTLATWTPGLATAFRGPVRTEVVESLGMTMLTFQPRGGILVLLAYGHGLALVAHGLLGLFVVKCRRRHRKQALIVFVFALVHYATIVVNDVGMVRIEAVRLPRLTFVVFAAGMAIGLYRYGFLEELPLVSRELLTQMDDAVLLVDADGEVVDHNPAASDVFGVTDPRGRSLSALDPGLPDAVRADDRVVVGGPGTVADGGLDTVYEPSVTTITDRDGSERGQLVVLRDVTPLHERERQLRSLESVLSRVLRHDLRTELNLIQGHAERLTAEDDVDTEEVAGEIIEATDRLATTSFKARRIENVILQADTTEELDLRATVERIVGDHGREDAEVRVDVPPGTTVRSHPETSLAIECVLQNAFEHVEEPTIEVTATRAGSAVVLEIADDGPGIPPGELAVLDDGTESQLNHSSGVGLWLASTIVRASGGDIEFAVEDGTTVRIRLPAGTEPTDGDADDERLDGE